MSRKRAHEILLEMLEQREYKIIDQDDGRIMSLKPDGNQMVVIYIDVPKFNVTCMTDTFSLMNELEVSHAIVVYQDGITPHAAKTAQQSKEMRIDFMAEEDLQYNITKHRLQPQFHRLEEKEATDFKKKFGIKFGTMKTVDPIARFYDYQRGDVIRITRKTKYVTYRIVKG